MLKAALQSIVNRLGYRLSRIRPRPSCKYINVLDLVVHDFMRTVDHEVVLIQIGANDGKRADPMHKFIARYNWRAVLVEPQPRAVARLRATHAGHPRVSIEQCAIADHDGTIPFFTVADHVDFRWTGLAQTNRRCLSDALVHHGFARDALLIKELSVPSLRMATLMRRHDLHSCDVLQIDAEGYDYEILKMFPWKEMRPAIINFEHAHVPLDQQIECWEFLSSMDYAIALVYGDTVAYRVPNGSDSA